MIAFGIHMDSGRARRAANSSVIAAALGLGWGLKEFYSRARFDDLLWVLAPTRWMVERLTGAAFELEAHRGYLDRDRLYTIIPPCAGVNFLIVVFCSLCCGLVHTRTSVRARIELVVFSAVVAYATTILANATRIAIGMRLHEADVSVGPLTPDRLHCAGGVVVYFLFLLAIFSVAARITGARRDIAF